MKKPKFQLGQRIKLKRDPTLGTYIIPNFNKTGKPKTLREGDIMTISAHSIHNGVYGFEEDTGHVDRPHWGLVESNFEQAGPESFEF